jgi:uncharacterized membrane protein
VPETPSNTGLTPRHWIALTALVAGMVAVYLHLWKLGLVGQLVCTTGESCERVQFSRYGSFLGLDVSLIGAGGYAAILLTALVGTQARWSNDIRITNILTVLIGLGFLFTLKLKYDEFILLRSFCPWCAISAVIITLQLILVLFDRRRVRRTRAG